MADDHLVLRATEIGVDYRADDRVVTALHDVSLVVERQSFAVLAGPSGSGKSSLLRVLGLLDPPTRGGLIIGGEDVLAMSARRRRSWRRRHLAYVHQRPITNLVDDLRAGEQLETARRLRGLARADPQPVLEAFGLGAHTRARPTALSGGEQQRLAFAMAMACNPTLIFADEPTAELDRAHADDVTQAIRTAVDAGATAVVASHDPDLLAAADTVLWLHDGWMS